MNCSISSEKNTPSPQKKEKKERSNLIENTIYLGMVKQVINSTDIFTNKYKSPLLKSNK
jgi:hypothetical protein